MGDGTLGRQAALVLAAVKNSAYLLVRNGRFGRLAQIGG